MVGRADDLVHRAAVLFNVAELKVNLPRAKERSLSPDELWAQLQGLDAAIEAQDVYAALELLGELVPEWRRGKAHQP